MVFAITRRNALVALSHAAVLLATTRSRAAADDPSRRRRFVFVSAAGGWDVLTTLAPLFDNANVEIDPAATLNSSGVLPFIDHPGRPATRAFFERHAASTTIVHGIATDSISHEESTLKMLTGTGRPRWPDFATQLASVRSETPIPHLLLSGPDFAGEETVLVARAGADGLLSPLVNGTIDVDEEVSRAGVIDFFERRDLFEAHAVRLERHAARQFTRLQQRLDARGAPLGARLSSAFTRAAQLKGLRDTVDLAPVGGFVGEVNTAVSALAQGLTRVVSVGVEGFDTHTNNDVQQSALFEELFEGLSVLLDLLASTNDEEGQPLLASTTVVVASEFTRTPRYNGEQGRDHWPYTSALLCGAGVHGGRVIGAWDAGFTGVAIDLDSGEPSVAGQRVTAEILGASVLALGGVDPGRNFPGVALLRAALKLP